MWKALWQKELSLILAPMGLTPEAMEVSPTVPDIFFCSAPDFLPQMVHERRRTRPGSTIANFPGNWAIRVCWTKKLSSNRVI